MASIPKSQANSESQTAHDTILSEENQLFITTADGLIQQAIAQGKFQIDCVAQKEVGPHDIAAYYINLGYGVAFPEYNKNHVFQPVNLFGEAWQQYWLNGLMPKPFHKPFRIIISWK
jgi:hypothetical protein